MELRIAHEVKSTVRRWVKADFAVKQKGLIVVKCWTPKRSPRRHGASNSPLEPLQTPKLCGEVAGAARRESEALEPFVEP